MKNRLNTKEITTDVLIIGGGTAGCYAALVLSETESRQGTDRRKANIKAKRLSGSWCQRHQCLHCKGRKAQDYVDYATKMPPGS